MLISFLKQQRQLSHQQVGEQTFSDVLSIQASNFLLCHPQRISMQADCLKMAVLLLGNHKEDRSELITFIYLFIYLSFSRKYFVLEASLPLPSILESFYVFSFSRIVMLV